MDDSKLPYNFSPDSELLGLKPLVSPSTTKSAPQGYYQRPFIQSSFVKSIVQQNQHRNGQLNKDKPDQETAKKNDSFLDDFPPLGRVNKAGSRS